MNKHNIILQPSGRRGQVEEGMSVRSAARELGVEIESQPVNWVWRSNRSVPKMPPAESAWS